VWFVKRLLWKNSHFRALAEMSSQVAEGAFDTAQVCVAPVKLWIV